MEYEKLMVRYITASATKESDDKELLVVKSHLYQHLKANVPNIIENAIDKEKNQNKN